MRLTILALCFCLGPVAVCQSTAPITATPKKQNHPATQPWTDFTKLKPDWLKTSAVPVQPDPNVSRGWNNPQRDWKLNLQEPLSTLSNGGQAPWKGVLVAQAEHPDPQLPFGSWPNAKVEPIPTQWPKAVIEQIPTQWLNDKLLPIATRSGSPVMWHAPTYGDSK
jgi:hypothetical protein